MQIKLDFNINGGTARLAYLKDYLEEVDFNRLTKENLELMSNYILWGVEADDPTQNFEIESKNSPWAKGKATTSFEALLEQEQETGMPVHAQLSDVPVSNTKFKLERAEVFTKLRSNQGSDYWKIARRMIGSRAATIGKIIEDLQKEGVIGEPQLNISSFDPMTETWFNLWQQIDVTEFMVQNWELEHGKRRIDLPIREELHFRLACLLLWRYSNHLIADSVSLASYEDELQEAQRKWEGYDYLRKKRGLVQLRTQQYSLLDNLQGETIMHKAPPAIYWCEEDKGLSTFYPFADLDFLIDGVQEEHFREGFQKKCVEALRAVDRLDSTGIREMNSIDLRKTDVIRQLVLMAPDLEESAARASEVDGVVLRNLLKYLSYYIEQCDFEPELLAILQLKMQKVSNKRIAEYLKKEYELSYKENYISTIFTKRIIEAIAEQVQLHYRLIEFITIGKTVFKRCNKCGKMLPRNETYYNRRTSAGDGFFSSCKRCKTRRKE